jgi:hypothetical protein
MTFRNNFLIDVWFRKIKHKVLRIGRRLGERGDKGYRVKRLSEWRETERSYTWLRLLWLQVISCTTNPYHILERYWDRVPVMIPAILTKLFIVFSVPPTKCRHNTLNMPESRPTTSLPVHQTHTRHNILLEAAWPNYNSDILTCTPLMLKCTLVWNLQSRVGAVLKLTALSWYSLLWPSFTASICGLYNTRK